MVKNIFVNLPVKDLAKTTAFFTALGFSFDKRFSDDKAVCVILGDHLYAMLLTETFYATFTEKQLVNTATHIETINALQVESKEQVDATIAKVVAAGGKALKTIDMGWMYDRAFEDLDGHTWEVFWQDESKIPQ